MRFFSKDLLGVLFLGVLSSATVAARELTPISSAEQAKRLEELQHVRQVPPAEVKALGKVGFCLASQLTIQVGDPVTGLFAPKKFAQFLPPNQTRVPMVILIPPIFGVVLEPVVAQKLCDMGVGSVIAEVNNTDLPAEMPSWGREDANNRHAIHTLRTLLDYVNDSPHFDGTRVGLFGSSLGGITATLLAGVEPDRIQAVVTVLAGGNLPRILATSELPKLVRLREERMQAARIDTVQEYEEVLHRTIRYDPIYFSKSFAKEKLLMVVNLTDVVVPTENQWSLVQAFGRTGAIEYSGKHVETVGRATLLGFEPIEQFFRSRFKLASVAVRQTPASVE